MASRGNDAGHVELPLAEPQTLNDVRAPAGESVRYKNALTSAVKYVKLIAVVVLIIVLCRKLVDSDEQTAELDKKVQQVVGLLPEIAAVLEAPNRTETRWESRNLAKRPSTRSRRSTTTPPIRVPTEESTDYSSEQES